VHATTGPFRSSAQGVCEHPLVSRTTIIVLVAVGATLAGFAIASSAERLRGGEETSGPSVAAGPQTARLDWREVHGEPGEQLVFTVDSIEVTKSGWRAAIGVENDTSVTWRLQPSAIPDGTFGLALFETGDVEELEARNRARTLPAVRAATAYEPELADELDPGASWEGVMSARGALVAGSWVRVVFGTLIAAGVPPEGYAETFVWITDAAYELQE
jgi:hypothetical protein